MIKVAIVGIGLIGGSIAKDLRTQMNVHVIGVDINPIHQKIALEKKLVDEIQTLEDAVQNANIIVLATAVDKIESIAIQVLDIIDLHTLVLDVGSTKEQICLAIQNHPKRNRFVACHPLAGTEFSGPNAALNGLFAGKKNIICEKEKSDQDALTLALSLFESLGMKSYYLSPSEHDKHLAYVSHLSHISSFTLGLTVLDIEKDESQIMNLASTGFESTVRLAKSSPETWAPIFNKNADHLCTALEQYIDYLNQFKQALKNNNINESFALMSEANRIKRILNK